MVKKVKALGKKSLPKDLDPNIKGIQGEGIYDPYWILEKYRPNPKNYKKHDKEQRKALHESVSQHGWVVPMVINLKTGYFVDGHGRVEMAAEYGIGAKIGFIYAEPDEEASIIATFDSLSLMSETDPDAHQQLLKTAYEYAKDNNLSAMKELTISLSERADRIREGQEKAKQLLKARKDHLEERKKDLQKEKEITDDLEEDEVGEELYEEVLRDHVRFKSDHPWKIPPLLANKLFGKFKYQLKQLPTKPWNPAEGAFGESDVLCYSIRSSLEYEENDGDPWGFLTFQTEDERFEHIYTEPSTRLATINSQNFLAVFEPEFSIYSDWSLAENLWSIFRRRWCARYLQEMGTFILPAIPLCGYSHPVEEDYRKSNEKTLMEDFIVSTLPKSTQAVYTNGRMQHQTGKDTMIVAIKNGVIRAWEYLQFDHLILYGGLDIEKYLHSSFPSELKVHYIDSYINRRRKWNKEKKRNRKAISKGKKQPN